MPQAASSALMQASRCVRTSRSIARASLGKQRRQFFDAPVIRLSGGAAGENGDYRVLALLPLVRQVAAQMRRHLPAHVELRDLIQEGVLGLMDAVRKFDASRPVKIESYARHRIRGAILDSLRRSNPASRDVRRKAHQVARAAAAVEARRGRPATSLEMAHQLGLSLDEWYKVERQVQMAGGGAETSLDQAEEERPALSANLPADERDTPFDACYRREQKEMLDRALPCLAARDRALISLYYQSSMTMKEIGKRLGIDESRVSQLHSRALSRLRRCVRTLTARPAAPLRSADRREPALHGAPGAKPATL